MAYAKLVKSRYQDEKDVEYLAAYLGRYIERCHYVEGGRNIISSVFVNPDIVAEQFLAVQYGESFRRRLYHLVISFDPLVDDADLDFAHYVGQAVCNMYPDYQSVFAVHEDKAAPHLHIMFNNCPIYPDKPKLSDVFNFVAINAAVNRMIDIHLGVM